MRVSKLRVPMKRVGKKTFPFPTHGMAAIPGERMEICDQAGGIQPQVPSESGMIWICRYCHKDHNTPNLKRYGRW